MPGAQSGGPQAGESAQRHERPKVFAGVLEQRGKFLATVNFNLAVAVARNSLRAVYRVLATGDILARFGELEQGAQRAAKVLGAPGG